jgi:hypothetical protein
MNNMPKINNIKFFERSQRFNKQNEKLKENFLNHQAKLKSLARS